MTRKKFFISVAVSTVTYIIGFIMILNNTGRLSVSGVTGYILCAVAGILLLAVFIATVVSKEDR